MISNMTIVFPDTGPKNPNKTIMVVPKLFFFLERETLNFGGFEGADFKFDNSFVKFQFSYIVLITNKTVSVTN